MIKDSGLFKFWLRFRGNKGAVAGMGILIVYFSVAILGPLIAPYDPQKRFLSERINPPSAKHLMGTDELGRDILSRLIYGARVSLFIQLLAVSIAFFAGVLLGSISGFYGGFLDRLVMSFLDILMAFPSIFLAIIVISIIIYS